MTLQIGAPPLPHRTPWHPGTEWRDTSPRAGRVSVDGKFFAVAGERFTFRGVTYGTFRPRGDGARYPERPRLAADLEAMAAAGFTVVRTYTTPTDDLLELAGEHGLRLLAGVFWPDWRYLVGASRRQANRLALDAALEVRRTANRLAGDERILALCLGNEVPADVLRWMGQRGVADTIARLADVVHDEDPGCLVTYGNYPSAEYLPLDQLDFLTFNVFVERHTELRRYLTRLHHLAGERPLVLGELGLHVDDDPGAEKRQADFIDRQLEVALERGVAGTCVFSWTDEWWVGDAPVQGWRFGLTRPDRSDRPALDRAARWNRATVADLEGEWPSLSVVICAYNAADTLDECLTHTCRLDYPDLEIVVVDDGSTDNTAAIAGRHPRARLVTIEHAGLGVARNAGLRAARGEVIAYLDADAYPSPEWPYYLVLGFDGRKVAGSGGPNVPPMDDPLGAQVVARSPGGPVHVLTTDNRAEHIPGCNMAFWRWSLEEVGGCDPVYTAAGDDVDLCWRILDLGWEIGFHPAALVWHHRRPGLGPYLRQQRGYGRAEALVEARHPNRFGRSGSARWHGRIYNPLAPITGRRHVYHGPYGSAAYQSVYQADAHGMDLLHQVGVPAAAVGVASIPLGVLSPLLLLPGVVGMVLLVALMVGAAVRANPPRDLLEGRGAFRLAVAGHHLLQPLARAWGRWTSGADAGRGLPTPQPLPGPVERQPGGVLLLPEDRPRPDLADAIVTTLRRDGGRVAPATEWEPYDAHVSGSFLVRGSLVTSGHPVGFVQVRVRRRLVVGAAVVAGLALIALGLADPVAATPIGVAVLGDAAIGAWRTGPALRRSIRRAAS